MKYLNCTWCGSSHGYLKNNCPSCGGTLTHKSELLNLILNKLGLNNKNNQTITTTLKKTEVEESSFFSSLQQVIISSYLIVTTIKFTVIALVLISLLITVNSFFINTSNNTSKSNKLNSQKSPKKLSAEQQIHQLMRDEKIKVGSKSDIENWTEIAKKNSESYKHRMYLGGNTYIVQQQITFPDGMYGSHSKNFILKDKVKLPFGDMAHNTVYFMSDGKCLGTGCLK